VKGPVAWLREAREAANSTVVAWGEVQGSHRVPWWMFLMRAFAFVMYLALAPVRAIVRRLWGRRPSHRLEAATRERWKTSPAEAVAMVRNVHDQLTSAERAGALAMFRGRVEIAPYGRFSMIDRISVQALLYGCEVALGRFDRALQLVGPIRSGHSCMQRVDCLLGMRRRDEAIACLRANLHLDGPKGRLAAKLTELEGSLDAALN
jgi:hypothetical protein